MLEGSKEQEMVKEKLSAEKSAAIKEMIGADESANTGWGC